MELTFDWPNFTLDGLWEVQVFSFDEHMLSFFFCGSVDGLIFQDRMHAC
jgi:hypothetical protein